MNTQERSFYNNVTGLSPTAITGVIRRLDRQHKKSIEYKLNWAKNCEQRKNGTTAKKRKRLCAQPEAADQQVMAGRKGLT